MGILIMCYCIPLFTSSCICLSIWFAFTLFKLYRFASFYKHSAKILLTDYTELNLFHVCDICIWLDVQVEVFTWLNFRSISVSVFFFASRTNIVSVFMLPWLQSIRFVLIWVHTFLRKISKFNFLWADLHFRIFLFLKSNNTPLVTDSCFFLESAHAIT